MKDTVAGTPAGIALSPKAQMATGLKGSTPTPFLTGLARPAFLQPPRASNLPGRACYLERHQTQDALESPADRKSPRNASTL